MRKILFWERTEADPYNGYHYGDIIPAGKVEEAVSTFEFSFLVWEDIQGDRADDLNDRLPEDVKDLSEYELEKVVSEVVGAEGKTPYAPEDIYTPPAEGCLAFDLDECRFFDLGVVPTFPVYGYVRNSNWTYACFGEEHMLQYEFEVLDSYNLDYQERPGSTDFTYGGMGNHAKLEKVKDEDGDEYLLMHLWSQWQGSELDQGYLLTKEEALEELAEHPEIEEIRVWLEGED